jgi:hypothetical protein
LVIQPRSRDIDLRLRLHRTPIERAAAVEGGFDVLELIGVASDAAIRIDCFSSGDDSVIGICPLKTVLLEVLGPELGDILDNEGDELFELARGRCLE